MFVLVVLWLFLYIVQHTMFGTILWQFNRFPSSGETTRLSTQEITTAHPTCLSTQELTTAPPTPERCNDLPTNSPPHRDDFSVIPRFRVFSQELLSEKEGTVSTFTFLLNIYGPGSFILSPERCDNLPFPLSHHWAHHVAPRFRVFSQELQTLLKTRLRFIPSFYLSNHPTLFQKYITTQMTQKTFYLCNL
jgi:hypothetical protein